MENKNAERVLDQPDQHTYYNAVQLSLPVNTLISLEKDDPVFAFLEAVESVDFSRYVRPITSNNTRSHDRGMLVKVLLFGYMNGVESVNELSRLCRTDLRYLYLSNEERPSAMAFSRVCDQLTTSIDSLFFDLSGEITALLDIDTSTQFVDGTKIEANAQKNTFVYRKRIVNARDRLSLRITESINSLDHAYGYCYPVKDIYCAQEIGYIVQYLMEVMTGNNIELHYGKGHRRSRFQEYYDSFLKYALKLDEYEYWLSEMGERNSCSKTDHDATFMATKWDYYNQSGVTRPCYNCQIAVADGIIVNSEVYQTPSDAVTWIPFMDRWNRYTGTYPEKPVADAGYGGYDNYLYNIRNGIELVQKFPMYGKEHDKKFASRKYLPQNWKISEDGYRVCPKGRVFDQRGADRETVTRCGNSVIQQIFTEGRHCAKCGMKKECLNKSNRCGFKTITKNVIREELESKVRENLSTEEGIRLKTERSEQVEGAFGVMKQDMKFTRFHRKNLKNVRMEFILNCLGYDLLKYYRRWLSMHHSQTEYRN